jgi:hypothetical protein
MLVIQIFILTLFQPVWAQELGLEALERQGMQSILETGDVTDDWIRVYSNRLNGIESEDQEKTERVRVFVALMEAGLLVRNRDALVSVALRRYLEERGVSEAEAEQRVREDLQKSDLAKELRCQAEEVGKRLYHAISKESGPKTQQRLYVSWGYNRARFSRTDTTFHTPEGVFTIYGAQGYDRPTPFDPKVYFNPANFSIPQYNLTLGWQFHRRFAVELNHDHMKWVFDSNQGYEMSGEYSPTLYVDDSAHQGSWDPGLPVTFEQVKSTRDATWIRFEHTNGYNYVSASLLYRQPILLMAQDRVGLEVNGGAGLGLFIPQTSVHVRKDAPGNWVGNDNPFHIAGHGVHLNGGLRVTWYDRIFFQATARASWVRVTHALLDRSGAYLTQTPIQAIELIGQIGWQGFIRKKKSRH